MEYYNIRFLKDGAPKGRSYVYKSFDDLKSGDLVNIPGKAHGIVIDEPVDMNQVKKYGDANIREVQKYVEPERGEDGTES